MFDHVMNFHHGEEIDTIRDTVRRWSQDRLAPLAQEIDQSNAMPRELWAEMGALGMHGITVPEADGGLGLGYLAHAVAVEEVTETAE